MGRKRQKLVGWDKGSLTEQQTKGTVTTTVQIRRIHNTKQQNPQSRSHCPLPCMLPSLSAFLPPRSPQPEPGMVAHGVKYPVLFVQVESACLAVFPPGFW